MFACLLNLLFENLFLEIIENYNEVFFAFVRTFYTRNPKRKFIFSLQNKASGDSVQKGDGVGTTL